MKFIIRISLLLFFFSCESGTTDTDKFESSKWKTLEDERYLMVNDIIENDLLLNKSKEEVVRLLGDPAEDGPCDNCIGYSTNDPDQVFFSLDHEVLQINFNDQNKVIAVVKNSW